MRLLQVAMISASLLVTATSATAMTRPPSESAGGSSSSGGTAVPEPGAFAMMGTGIAGYGAAVALYRRKKRKQR